MTVLSLKFSSLLIDNVIFFIKMFGVKIKNTVLIPISLFSSENRIFAFSFNLLPFPEKPMQPFIRQFKCRLAEDLTGKCNSGADFRFSIPHTFVEPSRSIFSRPDYRYGQTFVTSTLSLRPDYCYGKTIDTATLSLRPDYSYGKTIDTAKLSLRPDYRYDHTIVTARISLQWTYPVPHCTLQTFLPGWSQPLRNYGPR
jgi:hypothetical protein